MLSPAVTSALTWAVAALVFVGLVEQGGRFGVRFGDIRPHAHGLSALSRE